MKILIATFGSLGDIHPYLAISEKLVEHGASVTIATSGLYREKVEAAGHRFHAMRPDVSPDPELLKRFMSEFMGSSYLLKDFLFPALRDSYADLMAAIPHHDLLVSQIAAFAAPLAARVTGIPWVSTVLAPLCFGSLRDPSALATPLIGLRGRSIGLTRIVNRLAMSTAYFSTLPIRRLQKELGLKPVGNPIFDGQHSPQRVLALFSKHFAAPQTDWPANTCVTGFPLRPPAQPSWEIEQFLSSGSPPVVFTLGSSAVHNPGDFYKFASSTGHRALLLAGAAAADFPRTSDLLAVDYAPHSAVFPRAAAIVHQAGMGTMSEALRSGRPSLIVPFAHDQPDNASRCERLGVARVLSRRALSLKNFKRELDPLLNDPCYSNASTLFAAQLNREDGVSEAARLILDAKNRLS